MNKKFIEEMFDGYWYRLPNEGWKASTIGIFPAQHWGKETLFFAMDKETWTRGSGNRGDYIKNYIDTHVSIVKYQSYVAGVVAQRPIEELDENIPQFIVKNSYDDFKKLSEVVRRKFYGKVVAITGTVGKTSTKDAISRALLSTNNVVFSKGGSNCRTSVRLTLANAALLGAEYAVIETAVSALWTRDGGLGPFLKADIAVVTHADVGQKGLTARQTAQYKARIANGMSPAGTVVVNRDIDCYYFLCKEIRKNTKSARIVSYGVHQSSDIHIEAFCVTDTAGKLTLKTDAEKVTLNILDVDNGSASNLAASFSVLRSLGLDVSRYIQILETRPSRKFYFEKVNLSWKGNSAVLIDDSYNAELASMLNSIDVFKRQSRLYRGKKVIVAGEIYNLQKRSPEVHTILAKNLALSGADKVYFFESYGDAGRTLMENLPESMQGGYYTSPELCSFAVAKELTDDSFVLFKGSRRASEFPRVRDILENKISAIIDNESGSAHYVSLVDLSKGEILKDVGSTEVSGDIGIGNLIIIYEVLMRLSMQKIKLEDTVTVDILPSKNNTASRAIGLKYGDKISLYYLLMFAVNRNSPDAILALAEYIFGSNRSAMLGVKDFAKKNNLSADCTHNISGRSLSNKRQMFFHRDLVIMARLFSTLPLEYLSLIQHKDIFYEGRVYSPEHQISRTGNIYGGIFWGENNQHALILVRRDSRWYAAIAISCSDHFGVESNVMSLLDDAFIGEPESCLEPVKEMESSCINIIGDTYFGESYTRKRLRTGQKDALTTYGYAHSFKMISSLFRKQDFNIVNFEAVFVNGHETPLRGIKSFILDANAKKSITELKDNNIKCVTLANNHLMDYGAGALKYTLDEFQNNNLVSIGAGLNHRHASRPIILNYGGVEVAIFNGYWYRRPAFVRYGNYALGNQPGVCCITGGMTERMRKFRLKHPNTLIIAIAHWGVDFNFVDKYQVQCAEAIVAAGADVVIGHGPHMMQSVRKINTKPVIYSIGNGVFNSNGEYDKRGMPPYGFVVRLDVVDRIIRLYPIFTNNLRTFWQPNFVSDAQMDEVVSWHDKWRSGIGQNDAKRDELGHYFVIDF
uniref:CapA family protein n=1 Tax=Halomonas sp. TaxID=1486246 RepID=UPI002639FE33|nr:CapA family protein [Halomonas sp.]